jgi:hypothetical protein
MSNIIHVLQTAPALFEAKNLEVIEAEKQLKITRAKLAASRSAYTLKWKNEKNAKITDAYVESEADVQALVLEEIEKDAAAKIAKNKAEGIENAWISARKLAGLNADEIRAANGATIQSNS